MPGDAVGLARPLGGIMRSVTKRGKELGGSGGVGGLQGAGRGGGQEVGMGPCSEVERDVTKQLRMRKLGKI